MLDVVGIFVKVNWLLMSCWCFVGCCELCWFVHKVHCVKTIVLKVNLKCMTIYQLKKRQQMHTYTCYSTHTPCTHKQTHIIITYLTNCNNQNNNFEHLSLSWEIVYICLGGIE